jgi:hypothetical protein
MPEKLVQTSGCVVACPHCDEVLCDLQAPSSSARLRPLGGCPKRVSRLLAVARCGNQAPRAVGSPDYIAETTTLLDRRTQEDRR